MAENFSSAEQGLIAVSVGNQSAGSAVTLKNSSGDVIAEVTPQLDYAVVYISTEDMAQGETYTLTAGSYSESITLSDLMYSTLSGGMGGSFGGGGPRGGMNADGQKPGIWRRHERRHGRPRTERRHERRNERPGRRLQRRRNRRNDRSDSAAG